jgi:hypothetical protein
MKYPVLALSLAMGVAAQAQSVISFNVDVFGTISGGSQYAGVVSAPNWNDTWLMNGNASGSTGLTWNNLVNNAGAGTGMSATYVNYLNWWQYYSIQGSAPGQDSDGSYNRNLLNGFFNDGASNDGGGANLSLASIPFAQYDLYVYFSSDAAGRAGTVNVGSTTYDFSTLGSASIGGANAVYTQTTDTLGNNPGANYAVFSGLTGSSQTINVNIANWGGLAGFQIVAVPEPSTMALSLVGATGMLLLRRRR